MCCTSCPLLLVPLDVGLVSTMASRNQQSLKNRFDVGNTRCRDAHADVDLGADDRNPEIERGTSVWHDRIEENQTGESDSDDKTPWRKACDDDEFAGKFDAEICDQVDRKHDNSHLACHIDYAVDDPEDALEALSVHALPRQSP